MSGTPRLLPAVALGVGTGLLAGLFGVGGGVVLVPGLVFLLGLAQHHAHATSLVAILFTAPAALAGFALAGEVDYAAAALLSAGSVAGAWLGAAVMHRLSETRLRQGFAVLLIVVAVRLAFPAGAAPAEALDGAVALAGLGALGVATGVLAALLGVGGGVILVPALVLLFGFGQHLAEGTSLLVVIPTALMATFRHAGRGYADWRLGAVVGAAGVVSGVLGAQVALAVEGLLLQRLFALLLVVMAVRMLWPQRGDSA